MERHLLKLRLQMGEYEEAEELNNYQLSNYFDKQDNSEYY
jgi:hypothetical protein